MTSRRPSFDDFLFAPVNAQAAAWFRIAFAAAIPFLFESDALGVPIWAPPPAAWVYEHVLLQRGYTIFIALVCAVLASGWRARAVASLLFVLLLPLAGLEIGQLSRQVMLTALLCFSFIRSGTVRFPWRRTSGGESSAGPAWPIRLIQLQLTVLYGVNALAKSTPQYLSGEALMDLSAELSNFRVDLSDGVMELAVLAIPLSVAAPASALAEYFLAAAFWVPRLKWVAALAGLAFHALIARVLTIFMLDYATIFLYLAFLLPLFRPRRAAGDA
jgi:hypothetical protein